jgi:hypothetical protein
VRETVLKGSFKYADGSPFNGQLLLQLSGGQRVLNTCVTPATVVPGSAQPNYGNANRIRDRIAVELHHLEDVPWQCQTANLRSAPIQDMK